MWSAWKNGERARREQSERKGQGETGERLRQMGEEERRGESDTGRDRSVIESFPQT